MILTFDCETTTINKGSPYDKRNSLVVVGCMEDEKYHEFWIEYDGQPYSDQLQSLKELFARASLVVGFNLKFDLAWLKNYGIHYHGRVWDCQLVEYLVSHQQLPWYENSLNKMSGRLDLGQKEDVVKTQFWEQGIDTQLIPKDILSSYLKQDVTLTYECFKRQREEVKELGIEMLVRLHNADLCVLLEMEYNGLRYDKDESLVRGDKMTHEAEEKVIEMQKLAPVPSGFPMNYNSGDHLSLLLYGGKVTKKVAEPYEHTYKSGTKMGQTETRNRWHEQVFEFPQQVRPLPKTGVAKDGFWKTDEQTLRLLEKTANKNVKKLLTLLLEYAKIDKQISTYYYGIPKLMDKYEWTDTIHGSLNQIVAATGRLSASEPNQQNMSDGALELMRSRYE